MRMVSSEIELLGSYYTLAGPVVPLSECEVSPIPFEERVEAAAEAGYKGMGLLHEDLVAVRDRLGLKEMRHILDANGIPHVELEMLAGW